MYFLGTLEKILASGSKPVALEAPTIQKEKKEFRPYKNDKGGYVKKEYPKNSSFKNSSYKPKEEFKEKEKFKSQNCFGLWAKDGDTFEAMYDKQRTTFRLSDIDCPEKGENYSNEAKKHLDSKIKNKVIYLDFKGLDPYERHIVEIFEDKEKTISINSQLLKLGLATSERYMNNEGEKTNNIIEHASNKIEELVAKVTEKGIWSEPKELPRKIKFPK